MAAPLALWGGKMRRSYWSFLTLLHATVTRGFVSARAWGFFAVSLLPVSPGSAKPNTALCCVRVGSLRARPQPICTSSFFRCSLYWCCPPTLLFYLRLVQCLHVSLTLQNVLLGWKRKISISCLRNFTDEHSPFFTPPSTPTTASLSPHLCEQM